MRSTVYSTLSTKVRTLGVTGVITSVLLLSTLLTVGCDKSEPAAPPAGQPQNAGTVPPTPVAEPATATPAAAGAAAGAAVAAADVAVAETACTDLSTK
ncbi:MAG: hypothetical protein HUU55_18500, partial [Myxococcales bacterium]|nr:hypothetical protein [Myxococcales bacterium]